MLMFPWKKHLFTQRYTFSHLMDAPLDKCLGLSPTRRKEVLQKLIAVAKVAPRHSQIIESFLNYDKFTDTEKAFGVYALGEIYGIAGMVQALKVKNVRLPSDMAFLLQVILKNAGVRGTPLVG